MTKMALPTIMKLYPDHNYNIFDNISESKWAYKVTFIDITMYSLQVSPVTGGSNWTIYVHMLSWEISPIAGITH